MTDEGGASRAPLTHRPNPRHLPPAKSAEEYERDIANLEAFAIDAREVLRGLEFSGSDENGRGAYCPECGWQDHEVRGTDPEHSATCRLAALLEDSDE